MKNFCLKYFGVMGWLIYIPSMVLIRIPVFILLFVYITVALLLIDPIFRTTICDKCDWVNKLYDWYKGE